jgi:hypothetical protein
MRQLSALAWKEWREVRWVLGFSLVTFVVLPLLGGIEMRLGRYRHFEFNASGWVMFLGGFLATVVAATAVCRDLNGPLPEFWRSRPVGVRRWLLVKYAVGLGVVLIACILPLAIEEWTERNSFRSEHYAAVLTAWFPFLWAVQYSLGFACGCLTRRPGSAVMLALALALLAYFLPLIIPPFRALSIPEVLAYSTLNADASQVAPGYVPWVPFHVPFVPGKQMPLVIASLMLSLCALALAVVAVTRDWRVQAARGLMYWSVAIALLLLFASAAFQVATNLPVLQTVDLPADEHLLAIHSDGRNGVLISFKRRTPGDDAPWGMHRIEVTSSGVQIAPRIGVGYGPRYGWDARSAVWLPEHPDFCFMLRTVSPVGRHEPDHVELASVALKDSRQPIAAGLDLGTGPDPDDPDQPNLPTGDQHYTALHAVGSMLCASWWKGKETGYAVIDVSNPRNPRISSTQPFEAPSVWSHDDAFTADASVLYVGLPDVPGASLRERLRGAIGIMNSNSRSEALEGDVLAEFENSRLRTFRLTRLSEAPTTVRPVSKERFAGRSILLPGGVAEFRRAGRYDPSLVEDTMNGWDYQVVGGNGMIYVSEVSTGFGGTFNRLTVFDISDPARPHPAGHFGDATESSTESPMSLCPLPDGRVLVGSRKLYLLGPPPGH